MVRAPPHLRRLARLQTPCPLRAGAARRVQVQKKQINALLRKSLTFQKKNYCMNACLIISPILLTGLLGLLQFLIGRIINEEAQVRACL